jgi:hypothetical protein
MVSGIDEPAMLAGLIRNAARHPVKQQFPARFQRGCKRKFLHTTVDHLLVSAVLKQVAMGLEKSPCADRLVGRKFTCSGWNSIPVGAGSFERNAEASVIDQKCLQSDFGIGVEEQAAMGR